MPYPIEDQRGRQHLAAYFQHDPDPVEHAARIGKGMQRIDAETKACHDHQGRHDRAQGRPRGRPAQHRGQPKAGEFDHRDRAEAKHLGQGTGKARRPGKVLKCPAERLVPLAHVIGQEEEEAEGHADGPDPADPHDKRRYTLSATAKGHVFLEALLPQMQAITAGTLAPLTARDDAQLVRLLRKMIQAKASRPRCVGMHTFTLRPGACPDW